MTLAEKKLKIDLKQDKKAELSPIQNETADGTNFILEPKEDKTKPMNNDTLKGMAAYNMSRPAKKIEYIQQVGSKGSAFPMVAPNLDSQGMAEAKAMQEFKNRAAGPQNRKVLENNPNIMQPDNKVSASKFGQEKLMSSIASDPGIPNPQPMAAPNAGAATPQNTYGGMVQDPSTNQYNDLYAGANLSTPQASTFGMYDGPEFNDGLRKASQAGELDDNPNFKAAVDNAPGLYNDPNKKKLTSEDLVKKSLNLKKLKQSSSTRPIPVPKKGRKFGAPPMYSGDTKVTKKNVNAAEKDDAAHMSYLKRDVNYDAKHGGSKKQMLNDEKHISKLAGDLKYDHKKKQRYDNV